MDDATFILRWEDSRGTYHSKQYATEADARKARKWLLENGAVSVDIAVRINNKTIGALGDKEKPAKAAEIGQEGLWQNV